MKRLVLALLATLFASSALAQQVQNPAFVALACAFNTVPPTPVDGQFYFVQCDATGAVITSGGGGGTPGGSTTELQYNNAGAFGGISGWTTNGTTALTGGASTTLAIGGATIGTNALAVTGTMAISGSVTSSAGNLSALNVIASATGGVIAARSNTSKLTIGASDDVILTRGGAAATLQHGFADAAAPVAQTIKFQDVVAGTTNTAGVNATYQAPAGTGTGAGGSLIFQVAPAGSTGSAKNAWATALTIDSTKLASFAGSVSVNSSLTLGTSGILVGDTNVVAQRNAANAQTFHVYNTYTDASNYERGFISWSEAANQFRIGTQAAGTGTARITYIASGSTLLLGAGASSGIRFFTNSAAEPWNIISTGHLITPADNTYDIGASGATRPRIVYAGTRVEAPTLRAATAYTVATLPTPQVAGRFAYVTDQTTACPATGAALTGGGAVVCPVFDNGTAWVGG